MTDISAQDAPFAGSGSDLVKRRNRKQVMLQGLGLAAISFAALMLFILIASLVSTGYKAFTRPISPSRSLSIPRRFRSRNCRAAASVRCFWRASRRSFPR
jgi:hypothetical protein